MQEDWIGETKDCYGNVATRAQVNLEEFGNKFITCWAYKTQPEFIDFFMFFYIRTILPTEHLEITNIPYTRGMSFQKYKSVAIN